MKKIKPIVAEILEKYPNTRYNNNLLITKTLKKMKLPTDMNDLSRITCKDIGGVITRTARKIQEDNPMLKPDEKMQEKRKKMEEIFKEFAKGV